MPPWSRAGLLVPVSAPSWLVGVEILDGIASGLLGVAVPVLVADLTWESERTQTALGVMNSLQGIGGACSGLFGGLLVGWLSWTGAFLGVGVAAATALWLEETRGLAAPYRPLRRHNRRRTAFRTRSGPCCAPRTMATTRAKSSHRPWA